MPVARGDFDRVPTYSSPALKGVDLDLRDNVNLWGAPPAALAALREFIANSRSLTSYPSVGGAALAEALAIDIGVHENEIVAGCGSDDVIDACFRAVASPGERVAHAEPSFSMVPVFARLSGLEPVGVPLLASGALDVDGLLATKARVIYACSPNNPTGTVTAPSDLHRLIANAPGVVVVDEAYAEFSGEPDQRPAAPSMERVLVTRTFSKAWGLAGLRVGYGVGGRALVAAVARARGPYKVNAAAEVAAIAALRLDAGWMATTARESRRSRDRFATALAQLPGARVWDSRANFVFAQVRSEAADIAKRFQRCGVGVRAFSALPGIGEAIRIGVAPWEQMRRVVDVAAEVWR